MKPASVFVLMCLLASCNKPKLMEETTRLDIPHLDKVLVTFVRPSVMAPTTKFGLWDRENFIGELKVRSYIQYETTPGEHLFLAQGEVWSYLRANLQGGRHYVVKAEVIPGGHTPRVHLAPVIKGGRTSQEDLDKWFDDLDGFKPSEAMAGEYIGLNLAALKKAVKRYDDDRIVCETLSPGDAW